MRRLMDNGTVPPGGFRFFNAETRTWIQSSDFNSLLHSVKVHRQGNNLPLPLDLYLQIEDQLCSFMPPGVCHHSSNGHGVWRSMTLNEVINGTLTIGEWLVKGGHKVSQEEANRRARICCSCFQNQPVEGCTNCSMGKIHNAVKHVVGDSTSDGDECLKSCMSCGCALKASVWLPLDIQQNHMSEDLINSLPEWCWKKEKTAVQT